MAWYYGVNNSELYGSNFSTVLADAPPPLDDTYEEDENEIVFRNEGKKSKKYNGETAASSIKKSHSSDEKFNDKSKPHDSQVPNGEEQPGGQGSVEEDSDFGDFAGFADFGSAFGQESSGESQNWFTGDENSVNSPQAVKETNHQQDDDEYADFAAFQDSDSSLNQENIPNGGSEQGNSNTSDFNNCNKNGIGNRFNTSNDMDSDDDFGDFASVEKTTRRPEDIAPENNSVEIQPDLEKKSTSQGRTCAESDVKPDQVDIRSERSIAQCNGDLADENVVNHHGESTVNHTSEASPCANKGQKNEFGTKIDPSVVEKVSSAAVINEESRPLNNSSLAVKHGDKHPSDSSMGIPEKEEDQIKNNVGDSRTNSVLASDRGKENSESSIKADDVSTTKDNLISSNMCDQGSEAEILPENDDGFGEFADFTGPPMKQPSIDDNDDKEICDENTKTDSPEMSAPIAGKENEGATYVGVTSEQGENGDDEFGDFGSFDRRPDSENTNDFVMVDSKAECATSKNNDDDDDDFGDFGISDAGEKTLPSEDQGNDDFGTFNSATKDSNDDDDGSDDFGDFGISNSEEKTLPSKDQGNDDFGDFGTFTSATKDSNDEDDGSDDFGDFGISNSEEKALPTVDQDDDDFGDFGTFDSNINDSQQDNNGKTDFGEFGAFDSRTKDSNNDDGDDDFGKFGTSNSEGKTSPVEDQDNHEFGDFGTFHSNTNDSKKDDDDFGDFGSFESNTKDDQKGDCNSDSFGHFGVFDAQAKDSLEKNERDNELDDFGTFDSKENNVPKKNQRNLNVDDFNAVESKDDNKFGDFRTSDSPQRSQVKKNVQNDEFGAFDSTSMKVNNSKGSEDDFGDFSSGKGKEGSFTSSTASHSSVSSESFPKKNEDLKQRGTGTSYFVPGNNVIIKQVGDPISLCFISEQRHISDYRCDVLSSRVEKSLQSNLGFWQQLERSDKEGRILFHWSNSFSQHKKLLSLMIRPDRPPPLQGGSILKPMAPLQFAPFGGGLGGSMLMPEPSSKFPHFSSGLGFLEPVKGSQLPVQSTTQDKVASHQSVHPDMGLPDLSFVLGNGLKRTASKPDIKDNMSDTASESSSLDLDFFAPSTAQPSEGKSESRGLYEEDLLGLNIFASSVEPQKLDSPKLQKSSDTKKVWQHGGVTIPLSSQESRAQLSAAAKSILDELEDLNFMTSSVLMFPLKPE